MSEGENHNRECSPGSLPPLRVVVPRPPLVVPSRLVARTPPLSLRLPAEIRARLAVCAENEGLTVNRVASDAIRLHLDRLESGDDGLVPLALEPVLASPEDPAEAPAVAVPAAGLAVAAPAPVVAAKPPEPAAKRRRGRTDFCPHRRSPEQFCGRCDA